MRSTEEGGKSSTVEQRLPWSFETTCATDPFAILQAVPVIGCNATVRKALLLVLCLAALSGCGFKGPLELPPPNPDESEPENDPASSQRHSSN